ncbi:MAG: LysM peptidoglycan-binding domain-containing protein [Demequinaceae bacterium]|nr:LysM peptidoglycan-binding domain-containing protein [Demequinaceae bacterium]
MSIRVVNTAKMRARRWAAVVVIAVVALVVAPQAFAQGDSAPSASNTYVVAEGETLWSIARSITPTSRDVRDTVDTVKSMNLLDSADIRPGDQLMVPIYG